MSDLSPSLQISFAGPAENLPPLLVALEDAGATILSTRPSVLPTRGVSTDLAQAVAVEIVAQIAYGVAIRVVRRYKANRRGSVIVIPPQTPPRPDPPAREPTQGKTRG